MSDIRSWDLLKGVKAQDATGAQVSRVGAATFIEGRNKAALTGWTQLHGVASSFGFGVAYLTAVASICNIDYIGMAVTYQLGQDFRGRVSSGNRRLAVVNRGPYL